MDADKRGGILEKRSLSRILGGKFAAAAVAILGLCLIGTLAVCGTISAQAVKLDSDCSIKVQLSPEENASSAPKGLVYDLYEIATAQEVSKYDAYTFEATTAFSGAISEDLGQLSSATDSNTASNIYASIAQSATGVVLNDDNVKAVGASKSVNFYKENAEGDTFTNLQSGLYLVLVHGKTPASKNKYITMNDEGKYVTVANAATEKYLFSPFLVAVPSRDNGTTNNTANTGVWQKDVTATLKFTKEPRYGSLEIEKSLTSYNQGQPATFVFQIDGYESANPASGDEPVFSDVRSIVFNGAGTQSVTVDRIPAGLYVEVTEVYPSEKPSEKDGGASYKFVSKDPTGRIKITSNADNSTTPNVKFTFVNEYEGPGNGSGSVTNSFAYESEEGAARSAGLWVWSKDGEVQE